MREIKQHQCKSWKDRWKIYTGNLRTTDTVAAQAEPLSKKRLKVHEKLSKAESTLTTQIRTEKIGFADFLHKRKVPGVDSPRCPCGWHRQTAKHVIMFCRLMNNRADMLQAAGSNDYTWLMQSSKAMKTITRWLMKHSLLAQFSLASESQYQE